MFINNLSYFSLYYIYITIFLAIILENYIYIEYILYILTLTYVIYILKKIVIYLLETILYFIDYFLGITE